MDSNSLIIGLILLAMCILPLYFFNLSRKRKQHRIMESLNNIAGSHNCRISHFDVCGELVIGWDEERKFVFYHRKSNDITSELYMDLAAVKGCKVIHSTRTVKLKDGNQKITERVELNFSQLNNGDEVKWEFFNEEFNTQLNGELQLAEKWSKMINNKLKVR